MCYFRIEMKNVVVKVCVFVLALSGLCASCSTDTGTLGISTTPTADSLTIRTATYTATSRSVLVDSVLGKSGTVYLGRYTDPETGCLFTSDFITQFNCAEGGNVFPPADSIKGDSARRFELRLYFTTHYGAGDNPMQLAVYPLARTLTEGTPYYTNLDPTRYLASADVPPLAVKTFSALDYALDDDVLADGDHYHNVCIPLPTSMGTDIIRHYRQHPEHFDGATPFIENVLKGLYVRSTGGDGTVLCVDQVSLGVTFDMARTDSAFTTQFMGSQEVLQASSIRGEGLQRLADDLSCTWLKTPAGILTEVTLPILDITQNEQDTINSVKIVFDRYNAAAGALASPTRLLLIRRSLMHDFFEQNRIPDGITSLLNTQNMVNGVDTYLTRYGQYVFANIARLVTACAAERDAWLDAYASAHPSATPAEAAAAHAAACPDWDKVLLVPVVVTTDNSNNIVTLRHDLSLTAARLRGGSSPIDVTVITSTFK